MNRRNFIKRIAAIIVVPAFIPADVLDLLPERIPPKLKLQGVTSEILFLDEVGEFPKSYTCNLSYTGDPDSIKIVEWSVNASKAARFRIEDCNGNVFLTCTKS